MVRDCAEEEKDGGVVFMLAHVNELNQIQREGIRVSRVRVAWLRLLVCLQVCAGACSVRLLWDVCRCQLCTVAVECVWILQLHLPTCPRKRQRSHYICFRRACGWARQASSLAPCRSSSTHTPTTMASGRFSSRWSAASRTTRTSPGRASVFRLWLRWLWLLLQWLPFPSL